MELVTERSEKTLLLLLLLHVMELLKAMEREVMRNRVRKFYSKVTVWPGVVPRHTSRRGVRRRQAEERRV
jgi:hypothetical protein